MGFLSQEIERQMLLREISVDELAQKSRLSRSLIFRLKRGKKGITEQQMANLALGLSSSIIDHARLTMAHMEDERIGPGRELVTCAVTGRPTDASKPTKLEQSIAFLTDEAARSKPCADLLIALANWREANRS